MKREAEQHHIDKKKEAEDTGKYERATKGIKKKDKSKNERGGNREKLGENVFYFGFRSSLFGCIAFSLLFAFYNGFVLSMLLSCSLNHKCATATRHHVKMG